MTASLDDILARALERPRNLSVADLTRLVSLEDPEERRIVRAAAYGLKCRIAGKLVSMRGIVEIGNVCAKDCLYCGIRRSNANLERYRLSIDDILRMAEADAKAGYASIVLQGGEIESEANTVFIEECLRGMSAELAAEVAARGEVRGECVVVIAAPDAAELEEYFAPGEIDLIYLNFCDPWPRKKNAKRRLTYHTFLEKYKKVLKLGGQIHFKTDNANLFAWSLPEMESCFLELRNVTDDLHANGPVGIMTGYEEKFYALGTPIHRV